VSSSVAGIPPLTGRFKYSQPSTKQDVINQIPRKIIQFDIHGTRLNSFDSCREAARYIGSASAYTTISMCCNGKRKTSMGYIWKYEPIVK